jgi:uncharacterized protein DUF6161
MAMTSIQEPFITIPTGVDGSTMVIMTPEEASARLGEDQQFWQWLNAYRDSRGNPERYAYDMLYKRLTDCRDSLEAWQKSDRTEAQRSESLRQFAERMQSLYSNYQTTPLKTAPQWQVAETLRQLNQDAGAVFTGMFLGSRENINWREAAIGASLAFVVSPYHLHEGESVRRAIVKWNSEVDATRLKAKEWFENTTKQRDDENSRMAEFLKLGREDLAELIKRYKEIQEFKEPANYWQSRKRWHRAGFYVSGVVTLITAGVCGRLLFALANKIKADIVAQDTIDLWHVIPYSFPLLLASGGLYWLLRVLVRIVLSNYHIATDAGERVVLAKTFLALQASGAEFTKDDKLIVLAQLFRHASTDVAKDDASPPLAIKSLITEK